MGNTYFSKSVSTLGSRRKWVYSLWVKRQKITDTQSIMMGLEDGSNYTKCQFNGSDYIALGAFYSTKTKRVKHKATIELLKEVKKVTKIPIVAVGGIKFNNYKKLLLNKAKFLAISSYIWENKKLNPIEAIKRLK